MRPFLKYGIVGSLIGIGGQAYHIFNHSFSVEVEENQEDPKYIKIYRNFLTSYIAESNSSMDYEDQIYKEYMENPSKFMSEAKLKRKFKFSDQISEVIF